VARVFDLVALLVDVVIVFAVIDTRAQLRALRDCYGSKKIDTQRHAGGTEGTKGQSTGQPRPQASSPP
jgi:hypothetical protein